jgi:FlaA1/EpsC-like NDP-sugar epimerase
MRIFNVEKFVGDHVTGRKESFFLPDLTAYDAALHAGIGGKTALVIGGAGTIGSSFIKAMLEYRPAKLVVVDINENGLTELVRDCRSNPDLFVPRDFLLYPVSLGDEVFRKIFHKEGPFDIVANFSAHKHVRSEKDVYSVEAMIENNVYRALNLLQLLENAPPSHFFCVSTDKAANPVNVMGASKKLMEELIMAYSADFKVSTARFANVAFSNGSLLAGFLERIMKGQPLACPSDVRRFFVSPKESGQICLLACMLSGTAEIFFPKLGEEEMRKFSDVLPAFLQSFGMEPLICATEDEARSSTNQIASGQYPVYLFHSDTTGEKLYEEFYTDAESPDMSRFHSLGVIKVASVPPKKQILLHLDELRHILQTPANKGEVVAALRKLVPGFQHQETGLNLDHKM